MEYGASSYRRFLDGDDQGLYEIICAYQSGLVLYLNSMVQNVHTAEDLAEDTFAELATKMPRYSGKSSFKTWLYAIARHLAADHIRKCAKLPTVPLETQEFLPDEIDVEHAYLRTEQREAVHRALHRIRPDYRQVLWLSYFEGFSNRETAQIMHKTARQIENLLYNAKKALRSELERDGFTYEDV